MHEHELYVHEQVHISMNTSLKALTTAYMHEHELHVHEHVHISMNTCFKA